ncbi:MAG TPA: hypothetical protein VD997_06400 [Phycisphaerales bacterium]|nr:hypothetical protein [Phycisphaerales bacterium]
MQHWHKMVRLAVAVLAGFGVQASGQCTPAYAQGFYYSELGGGHFPANESLSCIAFANLGSGPEMLIGGTFTRLRNETLRSPARKTADGWATIGPGVVGAVKAITAYDPDGSGPRPEEIYIAGGFSQVPGEPVALKIAVWTGSTWWPFAGLDGPSTYVSDMTVHDDGTGPQLYIHGSFQGVSAVPANNLARYNGSTWSAVGAGVPFANGILESHTEAGGPRLYIGTYETLASATEPGNLCRWDGASVSVVQDFVGAVSSLASVDTPGTGGRALYVAGLFSNPGGTNARNVALFRDGEWQSMGVDTSAPASTYVGDAASFTVGGVPAVHATIDRVLKRWDGAQWTSLGHRVERVWMVDQSGPTARLLVSLTQGTHPSAPGLAWYDGANLEGINDVGLGLATYAESMVVGNIGEGERLYAIGRMITAGNEAVRGIASFDGERWRAVGAWLWNEGASASTSTPLELTIFDDGSGPKLYAALVGNWQASPGTPPFPNSVIRWDGQQWSSVGQPLSSGISLNGQYRLKVLDASGEGEKLYLLASGMISGVWRLDGDTWTRLPSVPPGNLSPTSLLYRDLAVWEENGQRQLILAAVTGAPNSGIYRLVGDAWQVIPGLSATGGYGVQVFDDGTGAAIYAIVRSAQSVSQTRLARYRSGAWTYGGGGDVTRDVGHLVVHDDGSGATVYALLDTPQGHGYRWQNGAWVQIESAMAPYSSASFRFQGRRALYLSGVFSFMGASTSPNRVRADYFGVILGCTYICDADFNQDGDTGTDQDIEAFFACIGGHCCPRCLSADFNGDGDAGTDQDIESFFRVLGGGAC